LPQRRDSQRTAALISERLEPCRPGAWEQPGLNPAKKGGRGLKRAGEMGKIPARIREIRLPDKAEAGFPRFERGEEVRRATVSKNGLPPLPAGTRSPTLWALQSENQPSDRS